jgi:hypothetical protein
VPPNPLEIIFQNRHPILKEKDEPKDSIWQLVYDSYIGGLDYKNGNYLIKYPKESDAAFGQRKKRSVYFNQVSPLVDMLSGMLFMNTPKRKIPSEMDFLTQNMGRNKNADEFMRLLSAHSLMFTIGVLIDLPQFDPVMIKTEKDRLDNNINPYAVMYLPFKIRDFNIEADGNLGWVLLDNSFYEHENPMVEGYTVEQYRLWTRNDYRDFTRRDKDIEDSGYIPHNLGRVPFRFMSWRDDNSDFIAETIFEDIAMLSRLIYNSMSYMDEMLASGTFKMLAYPTEDGTLPSQVTEGGLGPLSALPWDGNLPNKPEFIGATLSDMDAFIKAMGLYMAEILKKVGMDTDQTKEFVRSGIAKKIDFQKMRALLQSGAQMVAKTEEWIYETAALWMKKDYTIESKYSSDFSSEELLAEVQALEELMIFPVASLRQNVLKVITKKLLSNNLPPDIMETINEDIDKYIKATNLPATAVPGAKVDTKSAAQQITNTQTETGD